MIFRYLINCYESPAENAVVKNPIAALQKKHSGFYTSVFWGLIADQDPLPRQKSPSNMGQTRLFLRRRNRPRNGCTVTTSHMFHLRRPRIATVFATELRLSRQQLQRDPPGRGEPHASPGEGTYRSPHTEIFTPMVPLLCSDLRKKTLSKGSDAQWIPCSKQPPKVPMPDGRCDSA